ncbi:MULTISPECIES: hypothetical protein [Arsenophonus]|jgi:hypothetical protein|uniref:hypothetical protein n=1 Tax=Arsenophonus TaxID=637 RepID=UPI0015D7FB76|nr:MULTISPECIES: hypothetical protein [Arsenophonus]UBX30873.1 hypothetical protein LDL57_17120 [Arsenophonus apicola]
MTKVIILLISILLSYQVSAGVGFSQACTKWQGNSLHEKQKIVSINGIYVADGFKQTVKLSNGYHYSIHKDNPSIYELSKVAFLIKVHVNVCVRSNIGPQDELIGIEIIN